MALKGWMRRWARQLDLALCFLSMVPRGATIARRGLPASSLKPRLPGRRIAPLDLIRHEASPRRFLVTSWRPLTPVAASVHERLRPMTRMMNSVIIDFALKPRRSGGRVQRHA
jgi:hypothetical protein